MDLEELNKTQMILLTLLVSFVSAIATSIFTVRLIQEAPPAVTQTVNRVVERTVERVIPPDPGNFTESEPTVIEKETTVVVKEDDLITESIDTNRNKIVRVGFITEGEAVATDVATGTEANATSAEEFVFESIGVIVDRSGIVAVPASVSDAEGLVAVTGSGLRYPIVRVGGNDEMALMQMDAGDDAPLFSSVTFSDPNSLKLGQTVIAIGGDARTNVSIGIISMVGDASVGTNITDPVGGEPLINIFGELVGVNTDPSTSEFMLASMVQDALAAYRSESADSIEEQTALLSEPENESVDG
jgi:S1-C subfamily serine protease